MIFKVKSPHIIFRMLLWKMK